VDQISLANRGDHYGSDLIRGPIDTRVTLTVVRDTTSTRALKEFAVSYADQTARERQRISDAIAGAAVDVSIEE
jgi:hypothetical protein